MSIRMKKRESVRLIRGNTGTDVRGSVSFVNGFSFPGIKRFYVVENASSKVIRAFHGHMKEAKFVYVLAGSIVLCAVRLTDKKAPSKKVAVRKMVLSAKEPTVAYIPQGFANGFRALERGTKVVFFSTATLAESLKDDYRFPADYWGNGVWKV